MQTLLAKGERYLQVRSIVCRAQNNLEKMQLTYLGEVFFSFWGEEEVAKRGRDSKA